MTAGSNNGGDEITDRFKRVSSGEVADTKLDPVSVLNSNIGAIHPHCSVVGTARTVTLDPSTLCAPIEALENAQEGDIIVIDAGGCVDEAVWGELLSRYAAAIGLKGVITNGAIRDVAGIRGLKFPVFAKGRTPSGPSGSKEARHNVPVTVGGSLIEPNDILVGDQTGIVTIKQEDAKDVIEAAEEVAEMEQDVRRQIDQGESLRDAL